MDTIFAIMTEGKETREAFENQHKQAEKVIPKVQHETDGEPSSTFGRRRSNGTPLTSNMRTLDE